MADNNTESIANGPANSSSNVSSTQNQRSEDNGTKTSGPSHHGRDDRQRSNRYQKRPLWKDSRQGGNRDRKGDRRHKNVGRAEYHRTKVDKRARNENEQTRKRQKTDAEGEEAELGSPREDIPAEERKPKRKVAVFIGYAGTGYKGMQLNPGEKTIEGDLFAAFVAAGAISKANSDDAKKSSLVRCARTDKGVHAAGNMISLKLIIEDPDVVKKINDNLPPQIRVWGIQRTNGSFSCYQACDSRWYEYLIPTYSFLPPHPQSFLGKKVVESAREEGVYEEYRSLQDDVARFWTEAEQVYIEPILNTLDPETRAAVVAAVHSSEDNSDAKSDIDSESESLADNPIEARISNNEDKTDGAEGANHPAGSTNIDGEPSTSSGTSDEIVESQLTPLERAIREVKAAYVKAKKAYRISEKRRQRLQDALSHYVGTHNFHNYTVRKHFKDPSSSRYIRSFKVGEKPIIIGDTEWLSLKVHGQSFMMHQIRKMVGMAAMLVRCGTPLTRIEESYGSEKISIPKAPGLGLLLERPVFESYNSRAARDFQRDPLDFGKFEKEIEEFKTKEIYERIFREEEAHNQFHVFFHHADHFQIGYFLWVTATGIPATKQASDAAGKSRKALDAVGIGLEDDVDMAVDPAKGAAQEG